MGINLSQIVMSRSETAEDELTLSMITKDSPSSQCITVALCKSFSTSYAGLDVFDSITAEWYGTSVSAVFSMAKILQNVTNGLYVTLVTNQQVIGNVVRLFVETPQFSAYQLRKETDMFALFPKRLTLESRLAGEMDFALPDETVRFALPDISLDLKTYALHTRDTFSAKSRFFMQNENAKVYGAYSSASFLIAAPTIDSVNCPAGKIEFESGAPDLTALRAHLYCDGGLIAQKDLTRTDTAGFVWDVSALELDIFRSYSVTCCRYNALGQSHSTRAFALLLDTPQVLSCTFTGTGAVLRMSKAASYRVKYSGTAKTCCADTITLDTAPVSVSIAYAANNVYGPALSYTPARPAYYAFQNSAQAEYLQYAARPVTLPSADIQVPFAGAPSAYNGTYFTATTGPDARLTIKKTVFTADMAEVHADYTALKLLCCTTAAACAALDSAVRSSLPMRSAESLFYHYGYDPAHGFVNLYPGMSLFVEYAMYQTIPDEYNTVCREKPAANSSVYADLNGFAGTGTARYGVIARNGKISFEPFIKGLTDAGGFVVPAPPPIASDNSLCGGAGVCDLLFAGLSAPFVRLVYPLSHTPRNSVGTTDYTNNICILAANTLPLLQEATLKLRSHALRLEDVAYSDFRGRVSIVPKIRVSAAGRPIWVSLGTTWQDLLDEFGVSNPRNAVLLRMSESGPCPVLHTKGDIPLLMGDILQIRKER